MPTKPPARIITAVWGKNYLDTLLSISMPAMLSPGNLPALTEHFTCTFVLVTEEAQFEYVRASPAWNQLGKICEAKLLSLDDLVAAPRMYGFSLTLAFMRGISDLGPRMTEVYLLFLNADFILADGSYRSLAARMLAGERLIHAPSYCVIEEEIVPNLCSRLGVKEHALTISPREMASLILAHRHYTIRGKTVNQRLFCWFRFDQFYWQVDDHTLLSRQLPISLVCMKPERFVTEMHTFWDFGLVSEFCPTTKPFVLVDSDEFLMMELRAANAFRNLFRLGWTSVSAIAKDLSSWTTKDQRGSGVFTLILHDQDMPLTLGEAMQQFEAFVGGVFGKMSLKPISHINHHYWAPYYPKFEQMRTKFLSSKAMSTSVQDSPLAALPPLPSHIQRREVPDGLQFLRLYLRSISTFVGVFFERLHGRLFGRIPYINLLHPFHSILRPVLDAVKVELAESGRKVLLVTASSGPLSEFVRSFPGGHSIKETTAEFLWPNDSWAHGSARRGSSQGTDLAPMGSGSSIDLCVCEVDLTDLLKFQEVFQRIRPLMKPKSCIIVFAFDSAIHDLQSLQGEIIRKAMLPSGQSEVIFSGSTWTKWALDLYNLGATLHNKHPGWGVFALVGLALCALPLSVIGNLVSEWRDHHVMPKTCLSLTMKYRLF